MAMAETNNKKNTISSSELSLLIIKVFPLLRRYEVRQVPRYPRTVDYLRRTSHRQYELGSQVWTLPASQLVASQCLSLRTDIRLNRDPFAKRRISQNVSTSDHTRSVLKIRLNGYPFSVIGAYVGPSIYIFKCIFLRPARNAVRIRICTYLRSFVPRSFVRSFVRTFVVYERMKVQAV